MLENNSAVALKGVTGLDTLLGSVFSTLLNSLNNLSSLLNSSFLNLIAALPSNATILSNAATGLKNAQITTLIDINFGTRQTAVTNLKTAFNVKIAAIDLIIPSLFTSLGSLRGRVDHNYERIRALIASLLVQLSKDTIDNAIIQSLVNELVGRYIQLFNDAVAVLAATLVTSLIITATILQGALSVILLLAVVASLVIQFIAQAGAIILNVVLINIGNALYNTLVALNVAVQTITTYATSITIIPVSSPVNIINTNLYASLNNVNILLLPITGSLPIRVSGPVGASITAGRSQLTDLLSGIRSLLSVATDPLAILDVIVGDNLRVGLANHHIHLNLFESAASGALSTDAFTIINGQQLNHHIAHLKLVIPIFQQVLKIAGDAAATVIRAVLIAILTAFGWIVTAASTIQATLNNAFSTSDVANLVKSALDTLTVSAQSGLVSIANLNALIVGGNPTGNLAVSAGLSTSLISSLDSLLSDVNQIQLIPVGAVTIDITGLAGEITVTLNTSITKLNAL